MVNYYKNQSIVYHRGIVDYGMYGSQMVGAHGGGRRRGHRSHLQQRQEEPGAEVSSGTLTAAFGIMFMCFMSIRF